MILEVPKTDKSFEERLIFKTFILKFVNAFSPIIYIAFFRGRLVQHSFQLYLITSAWFSKGSLASFVPVALWADRAATYTCLSPTGWKR